MIVYFLFLLLTVSLGRGDEDLCADRYVSCAETVSKMTGQPPCRIANAFMKCFVNTTGDCFPSFKDTVQKYQNLIADGCQPGSTFFEDFPRTLECLTEEDDPFQGCRLDGEFNTAAEVCSSVSDLIDCALKGTEVVCGRKQANVLFKVLRPIVDLLDNCKKSQDATDIEVNACYKGLLNCDRRILTREEYTCPEVERIARCYVDVADKHCDLEEEDKAVFEIIRKYVDQIPDYCNSESEIMQNLQKSIHCILSKHNVLQPCHERLQNTLFPILESDYESEESHVVMARESVAYRDCMEEKLGTACGDEAAFVVRYVLDPIVTASEDKCMEVTSERCNGSVSINSTILLLVLCLKYILTKEDN